MIRRPPRSTRTDTLCPTRRSSDLFRLAQDTWFAKRPGTSERTPWHHDTVIAGPFCSVWVALDPTPRQATLEFVRGGENISPGEIEDVLLSHPAEIGRAHV